MCPTIDGVDIVRKTKNRFRVRVVILQPDFDMYLIFVRFHVYRFVMERLFAAIQMLNKLGDPAGVFELSVLRLSRLRIRGALIGQRNNQTLVKECQFAQPL